jgi:IS5 family transposase
VSAAKRNDSKLLESLLDGVVPVASARPGRPRRRPVKLHADKGYDDAFCRQACRDRGILPRIARRGVESSTRLGRHRWVVERTFAWLARFRRLSVRYERRADIHTAFLILGCALICWQQLKRL